MSLYYRHRDPAFSETITARILDSWTYPFKDNRVFYTVEVTHTIGSELVKTFTYPVFEHELFTATFVCAGVWDENA